LKASALVVLSVLSKANSANWVFIPVLYYLCSLGLIFVFFPFVNHFAILLLPNMFAHEDIFPVLHIIADAVCILMQKSTSECFLCCSVLLADLAYCEGYSVSLSDKHFPDLSLCITFMQWCTTSMELLL